MTSRGYGPHAPWTVSRQKDRSSLPLGATAGPAAVFARAFSALINEVSVTSGSLAHSRLSSVPRGRGQFKAAVITLTRRA